MSLGAGVMQIHIPLTSLPGIMKFAMLPACDTCIACRKCLITKSSHNQNETYTQDGDVHVTAPDHTK